MGAFEGSTAGGLPIMAGLIGISASERALPASAGAIHKLSLGICHGEEAAFAEFYTTYGLRLYKVLLVMAKGNELEARETLQVVVVKLAKGFRVFSDEGRMWKWLCAVARNAFLDRCRQQRRDQRFVPLEDVEVAGPDAAEDKLARALSSAMEAMTAEERELVRAAYVDETALRDLAAEAGISYKALESRLTRARQKLKQQLLTALRYEE